MASVAICLFLGSWFFFSWLKLRQVEQEWEWVSQIINVEGGMHDDSFSLLRNVNKVTRWMLRLRVKNLCSLGSELNRNASYIYLYCLPFVMLIVSLLSLSVSFQSTSISEFYARWHVLPLTECLTCHFLPLFQWGLISLLRGVSWNYLTHMLPRIQHLCCAPSVQQLLGLCLLRMSLFSPPLSPVRLLARKQTSCM